MLWMPEEITVLGFFAAIAVTLFAGFVKGAVGFAMPLLMVSGLSFFLSPQLTVAAIILPILVSNVMQASRHGLDEVKDAVGEYWRYILIVCAAIVIAAQFLDDLEPSSFYLVLGIPVVVLTLIQLLGVRMEIPSNRRTVAEWGIATMAGTLGGLTGTWGPPTVLYLMALGTERQKQLLVQGIVYGLGAVFLTLAHLYSGILNRDTWPLSAALILPGMLGMYLGFRFGDRLNAQRFRQLTLAVLLLAGFNLIRRGLFG